MSIFAARDNVEQALKTLWQDVAADRRHKKEKADKLSKEVRAAMDEYSKAHNDLEAIENSMALLGMTGAEK